ncbi:MAG TPA: XamI family restriction endonuclease [Coriobacteriia bacterium]|nr:XamI family restriction endonuclease [Coriobacteriia bacterium]
MDESIDLMYEVLDVSANMTALKTGTGWTRELVDAARFFGAPMISQDDLATIVGVSKGQLGTSKHLPRTLEVIGGSIDPSRCPWLRDGRVPSPAELERAAYASAVVRATECTRTYFRNEEKTRQEEAAVQAIVDAGFTRVDSKSIRDPDDLGPGECVHNTKLDGKQCDVLARLHDKRLLAIECKASNSAVNSIKRLNEVADKATVWNVARGQQVITAAVVSGILGASTVDDAFDKDFWVFWEYDLGQLTEFVLRTTERSGL